jgi:hypothetical protein
MRRGVRDFVRKPWDNEQLVATLRTEILRGRERRQRMHHEQRELEEARRIQRQLLPPSVPQPDGWDLAASWQPAAGVAGDCFDAIALEPGRLAISIADVVGKGIPAALLMSNLQAAVRAFGTAAAAPADLCARVNRTLCGHIAEGRFISFFYCVLDTEAGALTFANAGHHRSSSAPAATWNGSQPGDRYSASCLMRHTIRDRHAWSAAIVSCCSPTGSRKPGRQMRATRSSATRAWCSSHASTGLTAPGRSRPFSSRPCRRSAAAGSPMMRRSS